MAVPVVKGTTLKGCASSVRVPAVRVPVVAIRASVTSDVSCVVLNLLLFPVRVIAVPPESDAVKLRAMISSNPGGTDVVMAASTLTPTSIRSGTKKPLAAPHRSENKGEEAVRVAAMLPLVTPMEKIPKTPGSVAANLAT